MPHWQMAEFGDAKDTRERCLLAELRKKHMTNGCSVSHSETPSDRSKTMQDQLPDVQNFLPMPSVKPPKTETKTMTNAIEQTKREMYKDLARFRGMVGSTHLFKTLEDSLEAHLEQLRQQYEQMALTARERFEQIQELEACNARQAETISRDSQLADRLASMKQERDAIQGRLHAIDHAYNEQQKAIGIAGEELIRVQGIARQHLDDCRIAEKLSDELDDKLRSAQAVIGKQEQLIVGQRLAIADLYLGKSKQKQPTPGESLDETIELMRKHQAELCESCGVMK